MYCQACGSPNLQEARFCAKCGRPLAAPLGPDTGSAQGQSPPPPYSDPRIRGGEPSGSGRYAMGKTPPLAVLLSFLIPGMGQFYNGDSKKGGIMLGLWVLSLILLSIGGVGFVIGAGVWIWAMVDAYGVAKGKTSMWS